jgi:serine O-acetyltransferase
MEPSLKQIVKEDLYRYNALYGFKGFIEGWFKNPGFRYLLLFRIVHQKLFFPIHIFAKLFKRHYRFKYGFEIDPHAQIGKGLYLTSHVGMVVVGPINMGKYCNIGHGVTIGRTFKNGIAGRPTLGDKVWIGAGAVIVGPINIGSNVMIAPNSFVNMDVPDNSIVIGNPAKIISKENPTKEYINFLLGE